MNRVAQLEIPEGMIDLGAGQPSPFLLPLERIREAAAACTADADWQSLAYGYPQGHGLLRESLARFLSDAYGFAVGPENLLITAGASQALDLICTLFTRPGDTVLVEEPTYFLALGIFADHGLEVVSVPMDASGIKLDALEEALAQTTPALLYTIPTFHNPAGVILSRSRRKALIELSRRHGLRIVADEVYQLLDLGDAPPRPLAAYGEAGQVLSLGSFSKILAPGLRLGWIQAAPEPLHPLAECGLLDSGGGMNPFTAAVVRQFIELGWQAEHLAFLKQTYQSRMAAMDRTLESEFGDAAFFHAVRGGYFRWVRMDEGVDTAPLLTRAKSNGVSFQPGVRFSVRDGLANYFRISWAYYQEDDLAEGIRRIAQAL